MSKDVIIGFFNGTEMVSHLLDLSSTHWQRLTVLTRLTSHHCTSFFDPNALNNLFDPHDEAEDAKALLSFQVDTWNVFVRAGGRIRIYDATLPTNPKPVLDNRTV